MKSVIIALSLFSVMALADSTCTGLVKIEPTKAFSSRPTEVTKVSIMLPAQMKSKALVSVNGDTQAYEISNNVKYQTLVHKEESERTELKVYEISNEDGASYLDVNGGYYNRFGKVHTLIGILECTK